MTKYYKTALYLIQNKPPHLTKSLVAVYQLVAYRTDLKILGLSFLLGCLKEGEDSGEACSGLSRTESSASLSNESIDRVDHSLLNEAAEDDRETGEESVLAITSAELSLLESTRLCESLIASACCSKFSKMKFPEDTSCCFSLPSASTVLTATSYKLVDRDRTIHEDFNVLVQHLHKLLET
eukprot:g62857.t1